MVNSRIIIILNNCKIDICIIDFEVIRKLFISDLMKVLSYCFLFVPQFEFRESRVVNFYTGYITMILIFPCR